MQNSITRLLDLSIETEDHDQILRECTIAFNQHPNLTWQTVDHALMQVVRDKLQVPVLMQQPLTAASFAELIERVADKLAIDPEDGEDLVGDEEEEDEEEEDSFVVRKRVKQ
jgi:exopolysaccharide biosynthesis predicted pyruvyltransferase EpsI